MGIIDFFSQFIAGQRACQHGTPCPIDASEEFKRGYAAEYELEQIIDARTKNESISD